MWTQPLSGQGFAPHENSRGDSSGARQNGIEAARAGRFGIHLHCNRFLESQPASPPCTRSSRYNSDVSVRREKAGCPQLVTSSVLRFGCTLMTIRNHIFMPIAVAMTLQSRSTLSKFSKVICRDVH
jgi:hypothetical protein